MGQVQQEFTVTSGANNLEFLGGPQYASPFNLLSVLYQRTKTEAIDMFLEVVAGGQVFTIDAVRSSGDLYYVFPNVRVPNVMALSNGCKVRFRTANVADASEKQSLLVNWADFT